MIRDVHELQRFKRDFSRTHRLSHRQALAFLDGLRAEGKALGVLPPQDPMSGTRVDIRVARILNSRSKKSSPVLPPRWAGSPCSTRRFLAILDTD